jgi:hypothetical protein
MTRLFDQAVSQIARLPASEQDALAAILLEELASEQRWSDAFASSQKPLSVLAEEARAEHATDRTEPLDVG